VLGAHDAVSAEAAVEALIALPDPPTAVFAGNNRITVGVLRVLGRSTVNLALVGFDELELGRRAAQLLVRRLEGDERPPQRIVLPTTLVPRGSGEVRP
jgi:LacI family transcriptional regulator